MRLRDISISAHLLCGAAAVALVAAASSAHAQARIDIPPQPLASALTAFSVQSDRTIIASTELTGAKSTRGVSGVHDPDVALRAVLAGTGLDYRRQAGAYLIVRAEPRRQTQPAAVSEIALEGEGAEARIVDELIVTAQKREENIQDVPIAISAFSQRALEEQKIEGGFDLLKAIPNVSFSKNNFSSYNFSIRGIGTKAVSVTTDPGVAVAFNSTALIRNRLFEQEYFDIERVEVLRGPQGTLYGRNATAGVINVISETAKVDAFDGSIKGEVGNYNSRRLSGFINVPLIQDVLAVRLAGAATQRDGYDYNLITENAINGRDLWSGRLSVAFEPTDRLRANFIWERFSEDDNRSRTGKQLCHRDPGLANILGYVFDPTSDAQIVEQGATSQGCKPGNLYDDAAFGTPNGLSIPFITLNADPNLGFIGADPSGGGNPITFPYATIIKAADPYGGMMQSRDLREVSSALDPKYRAKADVFELNVDFDISDNLSLTSQTAYVEDEYYALQDFNRFNTVPIFNDTSNIVDVVPDGEGSGNYIAVPSRLRGLAPNGRYCDPQLGCSDTLVGVDLSQAESTQFSQEFRLSSDFEGPFNFSVGANYTRYETLEDYYVFYNMITLTAQVGGINGATFNNSADPTKCATPGETISVPIVDPVDLDSPESAGCIYIDPNPLDSINGEGHNYFRSKNPYKLTSAAVFGEVYYQLADDLKLTAGLRYTDDRKTFTPVPSQILLSTKFELGGTVDRGYPALPDIKQHWGEFTGRLGIDWKPELSFTDDTLLYAFYSRGYKGGGANPPGIGYSKERTLCYSEDDCRPVLAPAVSFSEVFDPEFVNAYEIGAKNTLFGGALILNFGAFFYDYADYQVSQIKERTAVNENFDARVWGLELESVFSPSRDTRFNAALGYQDTSIGDGETSLDLMNRTQGREDVMIVRPWVQLASSCVLPKAVGAIAQGMLIHLCGGFYGAIPETFEFLYDIAGIDFHEFYAESNSMQGYYADLSGNELPNAPHWTVSFGAQHSWDVFGEWRATVRADAYWQSQSWARVYNAVNDKLHGWYNANLSLWFERPDDDLRIEVYVKNALDETPITDAFLNSDDSALTTNVFTLDPRLIGFSITKGF